MITKKLNKDEILPMIRKCYESDVNHMLKYHVDSDKGLEQCISRTVSDFNKWNVDIYAIEQDNTFIGYFGHENCEGNWLTGFFIMPEFRKNYKDLFWNVVVNHFDGNFRSGLYSKNEPAKKFLIKQGCSFVDKVGPGEIYIYKENI